MKCKVIHNHEQQVFTEQLLCMKHWERYKGFGTSCPSIACVRSESNTGLENSHPLDETGHRQERAEGHNTPQELALSGVGQGEGLML